MMAEGRNNFKPKRSHSYKPYDSANSSIVSRITNRVSGILPQPSSWLGRWLTPAEQQHFRSESEDDTTVSQQPPPKRFCLQPSNDGSPQANHVRKIGGREPELSPILRNRSDQPDGVVAGPSGLHLRGANFAVSTPAVPTSAEPKANGPIKVNGDEGSDGSESTSGCSSLVPQGERSSNAPFPENTPKVSPETPKLSLTPDSLGGRTLSIKPKNRTMDLSYSFSKSRPTFDAYAFNNPLNKSSSFNTSFNRTLDDSSASPFYRGRTMYGGSSSCKESLSLSVSSPKVGTPRIVSVKPTLTPAQNRDTISTSALKILRALEQFSTPVLDAKKIPLRSESERRKRKAVQPFEDLVIPTVPDLLRIKRKKTTSESSAGTPTPSSASKSAPKPYQLPPPVQPLSVRDDVAEPKRVVKGKDELSMETVEKVDLPSVPLPITTLPSFNLSSLPRSCSTYTYTNTTSASSAHLPSKPSTASSSSISSFSFGTVKPADPPVTPSAAKLKFSEPSVEVSAPAQIASIKPALKFREPLDAHKSESPKTNTVSALSPQKSSPALNFVANSSTFQPKLKKPSSDKPPLKSTPDNVGSVSDFFKKDKNNSKAEKSGNETPKSLSEQFKPKTGSWTCAECLVPNTADKIKCCCCETPREKPAQPKQTSEPSEQTWSCSKCLFKNKQSVDVCVCGLRKGEKSSVAPLLAKPTGDTWECGVCLVRNKSADSACVACSTPKPGAAPAEKPAPPSLLTAFKKPEGSWECSVCMVNNKATDSACVACSTSKPGAEKEKAKPTFTFGIPATVPAPTATPASGFSFGATSEKKDAPFAGFTFGVPQTEKKAEENKKPEASNLFTFGSAAAPQKKDTPEVVTIDDSDDEKERPPKKRVSFGEPLVVEKSTEPPKTSAPTAPTFSFGAAKTEPSTSFHQLPSKSIFGATSGVASSSTDAKTTAEIPFKFGNSGSTGVSSSTDSATGSVKSTVPATTASSGFSIFGAGTKTANVFPTAPSNNLFPSSSAENKATFSFGLANKPDAPKVDASSTNVFGGQKDNKTGLFGMPAPSEAKAAGFFNSTEPKLAFGTENKPVFGSSENNPTFGAVEPKPAFGLPDNKPAFGAETKPTFGGDTNNVFGGVKPTFGATTNSVFEMKPATTVNSGGFNAAPTATVFGSATPMMNNAEKPLFGALPNAPAATPFVFKGAETKPGGFPFAPSAPTQAPTNAFSFNAEPPKFGNAVGGLAAPQPSNVFGAPAAAPLFSNPTPVPASSPFTFGASQPEQQQQQQPPPFGFSAPQPPQAAATPFGFNVNNTMATPAQPPTFDPNQKPTFNFTGGATPSFAAPPSTSTEPKTDRKIRRAVRRTQPR